MPGVPLGLWGKPREVHEMGEWYLKAFIVIGFQ